MRFSLAAIVIAILVVAGGIAFIFILKPALSAPLSDFGSECTQLRQYELAAGFKTDVLVFSVLGAIGAGCLYYLMLRYQLFFPSSNASSDAWRFLTSTLAGMGVALLLTVIDVRLGPECLRQAIGSGSSIGLEEVAKIRSFAGLFSSSVWVAIVLDQLLLTLSGVWLVHLSRWLYLRSYPLGG